MEKRGSLYQFNSLPTEQEGSSDETGIENMLAKLKKASGKLSGTVDIERIPAIICEEFKDIFSALACFVSVLDEERSSLKLLAKSGLEDVAPNVGKKFPLANFPIKSVVIGDAKLRNLSLPELNGSGKAASLLKKHGVKSIMLVPLFNGENVIGLIEVYNEQEKAYGDMDLSAAKLLAAHSTTAIEKCKIAFQLERAIVEQDILHDASLAISSSLDIEGILTIIAEKVCQLLEATSVYVASYEPDFKISLGIAEYYGPNANDKELVSDVGKEYNHNYDFREVIKMFETGEPLIYTVEDENLDDLDRKYLEYYGGKSVMEIPLIVSGEFLGSIEIWDSQKIREFSQKEINLCETLAQQAAFALRNANLYQEAQDEIRVRKELEEKLRYDALHDVLTGLPNRLLFYDRLEQAILRKKRDTTSNFAVLYVDLDRFKYINDSFGHMLGDKVLIQAANAIRNCVRKADTVSRFGGDEFLILLNGDIDTVRVREINDRIQTNLKTLTIETESQIYLSASIGLVTSSLELETADEYLKSADIAMYAAKMKGGARVEIFSPTQELQTKKKAIIHSEILRASENNEFKLHFQPIMELGTFNVLGFEALLRWKRKSGELTLPGEFIPQLEGLGLISEVGNWVISESIKNYQAWQEMDSRFFDLTLSVNVSMNQLIHPGFVQTVEQILEAAEFDPSRLIIEVTESILINDLGLVTDALYALQDLGIKIHLDDFGTGFSSLSYLSDLPVNGIKIDRKFIEKIGPLDHQGMLINILVMATDHGLDVIAEGIETEEQLITLIGLNCQSGQGFLFSPGVAPNLVGKFVENSGKMFNEFEFV
jgi:diguanylate cyclase (GGDEF)-like protein